MQQILGKPKVLIVTTGGTITMLKNQEGALCPCHDASELIMRVPELSKIADLEVITIENDDSSNIQPELWVRLSKEIFKRINRYDGFVVTHGTDTLCYTASALSFMIQELPKPVVITGSQVPLEEIGSDGRANLINAVRVAIMDLAEVVVVFGCMVIRAPRAKKTSVFDMQAFTSVNAIPLGSIGLNIQFNLPPKPRSRKKPLLQPFLNKNVFMMPVFPGLRSDILDYIARKHNGIVLEGYGAGNIPTGENSLVDAIKRATSRNVPIVVCTQCMFGSTEMELYRVGRAALDAGAIPAMDMTPEATMVKLMWVLGQTDDLESIGSMMQKSFIGELHEVI